MTEEVEFLFDNQLIAAVEKLIRTAKKKLLLVSPFIDLDARIRDALIEKRTQPDFELQVLFGKNESNIYRSMKRDSMEFLKQFPNVEIRYNDRLHAKFYQNDHEYIMTSLNLYDYSLANNIEVGVRCEFALKGLLGKSLDTVGSVLSQGVDLVREDVLGMNKVQSPMAKFQVIFAHSELKYKTQAVVSGKTGFIPAFISGKKLEGVEVVVDNLPQTAPAAPQTVIPQAKPVETPVSVASPGKPQAGKLVSASQLAKSLGVQVKDITSRMEQQGLIAADAITPFGASKGLVLKNYMGNTYIAYPDNLSELAGLK